MTRHYQGDGGGRGTPSGIAQGRWQWADGGYLAGLMLKLGNAEIDKELAVVEKEFRIACVEFGQRENLCLRWCAFASGDRFYFLACLDNFKFL